MSQNPNKKSTKVPERISIEKQAPQKQAPQKQAPDGSTPKALTPTREGTDAPEPEKGVTENERMGMLLLSIFVKHLIGPLLGRYGRLDQVIDWIKGASLHWNEVFRSRRPVRRHTIDFELGREHSWSYRVQARLDRNEPVDEGAAQHAYTARSTLLTFFARNHDKSFTAGDVCRKFRYTLKFIQLAEYESLLQLYVGKQHLVQEGKRFRIRETYTPLVTVDRPQREAKLKRRVETLPSLSHAYLQGRAELVSLDAKLPLELWEEFQTSVAEFAKAKTAEMVARSNSPEFEGVKEYMGGAFMMVGPYPWTLPNWEEEWVAQEEERKQTESAQEEGAEDGESDPQDE